jgi:hypothetical protein
LSELALASEPVTLVVSSAALPMLVPASGDAMAGAAVAIATAAALRTAHRKAVSAWCECLSLIFNVFPVC